MSDELDDEKNKSRIAQWESIGVDAIRADLEHSNGTWYVGKHANLAWKWVRSKSNAAQKPNSEIIMLRPNFHGFGIDLRALWRWAIKKIGR